jgi:hypothetical protein
MPTEDFREWRLPQLLAMVSKDPHAQAAEQLGSWHRQAELLKAHRERLRVLRTELETSWPPERSEAAQAFILRVTEMIEAMDDTEVAARQIRSGLNQIAEALSQARVELQALHDQYTNKQAAFRAFNHRVMPWLPESMVPSTLIAPGAEQLAMTTHQRRLDERAREVMRATDRRVTEASEHATDAPLPRYKPIAKGDGDPAYVRALAGEPDSSPMRQSRSGGGQPAVPPPTFEPPVLPDSTGGDPVLAGGPPGTGVAPDPTGTAPPGTGPRALPGLLPGAGPWLWRTSGGQSALRPGGVIGGEPEPRRSGVRTSGVIGGEPVEHGVARPTGVFGGVAPATPQTPRTRPSHSGSPGRVLGEPREGPMHPMTGVGGWRDSQYEDYARRRRRPSETDPDNPWAVEEGVPPVLDAPDEPQFTAGPGVIGLDR